MTTRTVLHTAATRIGTVRITTLVPGDFARIHSWTRGPYAEFWGMTQHTLDEVAEIYTFLATAESHRAYLMHLDDTACGILQTYEPSADVVGDAYPVRAGDLGMHFLVAPLRRRPSGLAAVLLAESLRWVFDDPEVGRVVVDPDERNAAGLRRFAAGGFVIGQPVPLPHKVARLGFLERGDWERVGKSGKGLSLGRAPRGDGCARPGRARASHAPPPSDHRR
jgi:hypothetical protein